MSTIGTNNSDLINSSLSSPDTLKGGVGDDLYILTPGSEVEEKSQEGIDTVQVGFNYTLGNNVENLTAKGNISVSGNILDNLILGDSGAQIIDGGGGNDILTGGAGNDTFVIKAGNGSDTITDFSPTDKLQLLGFGFKSFNEIISASSQKGADVFIDLSGKSNKGFGEVLVLKNFMLSDLSESMVSFSGETDLITPATTASLGANSVYFNVSTANPIIYGTDKNDGIWIRSDIPQTAKGGKGDDTYYVKNMTSLVSEEAGEGTDTIYTWMNYDLRNVKNVENLKVAGNGRIATGNEQDNVIQGLDGNQIINGREGNDILIGGLGQDTFIVERGHGSDIITDFEAGDKIILSGATYLNVEEVLSEARQAGSDVLLRMGNGNVLTIKNWSLDKMSSSNIIIQNSISGGEIVAPFSDAKAGQSTSTQIGTAGKDTIWAKSTDTLLIGGDGNDVYYLANPAKNAVIETANGGVDTVVTWNNYTLADFVENASISGSEAKNLIGNALNNVLSGGGGYQKIDGGLGNDTITGGADMDTFIIKNGNGSDVINDFNGDVLVIDGYAFHSNADVMAAATQEGSDVLIKLSSIETLTLKNFIKANLANVNITYLNSTATPPPVNLSITGTAGADNLSGGAGDDTIIGGAGDDVLNGLAGDDSLSGEAGKDTLTGGAGSDTFIIKNGNGSDVITDFNGDMLTIDGYAINSNQSLFAAATQIGTDVVINLSDSETLTLKNFNKDSIINANISYLNPITVTNLDLTGTSSKDTLSGGQGNDTIKGGAGDDIITGNAGNDVLYGQTGNDTITGGSGNDKFVISFLEGDDLITDFQSGKDVLNLQNYGFTSASDVLNNAVQNGNDTIIWLYGTEKLILKNFQASTLTAADFSFEGSKPLVINGTDANNGIFQEKAIQTMIGGKGDDTYYLTEGGKIIEREGEGIDRVVTWGSRVDLRQFANVENATASGADNNVRTIIGNELNNQLNGGNGRQNLWGGFGNDTLTGGTETDIFVVKAGEGHDVIADFQWGAGGDFLRIENTAFNSFADIKSAAKQVGNDVVIVIDNDQSLTFKNTTLGQMNEQNVARFAPTVANGGRGDLLFSDEFDFLDMRDSVNRDGTWKTDGFWGSRTLNGETETYVDPEYKGLGLNPFDVNEGVLTITASKADPSIIPYLNPGTTNTSGMLTSQGSFSTQYGYFEMRAELPEGTGMWPAFWLLADNGTWPPEIDIFEVLSVNADILHTTEHWGTTKNHGAAGQASLVTDTSNGMHVYGLDWGPEEIVWYYDGVEIFKTVNNFNHEPMYMLMNLATGSWGGKEDRDTFLSPEHNEMRIDYVRVYERPLDHDVIPLPDDWADDEFIFGTVTSAGAINKRQAVDNMGPTEIAARIVDNWGGRTLNGNDKDNHLTAGQDNPHSTLNGKLGNDVLVGSSGVISETTFVIKDGEGNDTIYNLGFNDKIQLDGFHLSHIEDVRAWAVQRGDDVIIRLDQDQALKIVDFDIDDIQPFNFCFTNVDENPPY